MKNFFSKRSLARLGLLIGAVAIILLVIPRADHQSYSYELNQPWKYQLLTADFDMPIMRDSTSARQMRDSIDKAFIPFISRDAGAADENIARFRKLLDPTVPFSERNRISYLLAHVYAQGIVDAKTYESMRKRKDCRLRTSVIQDGAQSVSTIDGTNLFSPAKAFEYIDSAYKATSSDPIPAHVVKVISQCLNPNLIPDTLSNKKFLDQEYLNVDGAQGIIKKGQRIVDRGEIITPQVFTNLNTYMDMLEKSKTESSNESTYFYIGQGLYIILCLLGLYCYLINFRPRFFADVRKMAFLICFITFFVVFAVVMFEYVANGIYFVPFAAVPVVIMIFFDSRTAIFSLLVSVMMAAVVATFPLLFIFIEMGAGLVAALTIHQLSQRSQLLRTAAYSFLAYCVCFVTCSLLTNGDLSMVSWKMIGIFAINSVILSFAYILILIVEKVFGFTSNVTLVELSDINSPLLQRLAEEAPGTFQHSMQVSSLASEAARAIGANTQLVRTGALYHDIGKLDGPIFFTENQHGVNPHSGLDPQTSAQRIIAHVTDGLALAAKYKLPSVVRDFISQHHGRSITRYFYNTAVNDNPDKKIDIEKFRTTEGSLYSLSIQ